MKKLLKQKIARKWAFIGAGITAAIATAIIVPVALTKDKSESTAPVDIKFDGFKGTYNPHGNDEALRSYRDHQITEGNPAVAIISDGGHIDDKSFNQSAIWGVQGWSSGNDAAKTYRIFQVENEGKTKADFDKQYNAANPTEAYVVSGFRHSGIGKVKEWWSANKSTTPTVAIDIADNVKDKFYGITFKTEQSGFLAAIDTGFLLNVQFKEEESTDPIKVATFGGMKSASVTTYMNGFANGIKWWNAHKNSLQAAGVPAVTDRRDLELLHIDNDASKDFSGSFDLGGGKEITKKFISMGARAIMAVAGQQTKDVVDVIDEMDAHGGIFAIGVDVDQSAIYGGDILTSAIKGMEPATSEMLAKIYAKAHSSTPVSAANEPADIIYDISKNQTGGSTFIGSTINKHYIDSSSSDYERLNFIKSNATSELKSGSVDAQNQPLWTPEFA